MVEAVDEEFQARINIEETVSSGIYAYRLMMLTDGEDRRDHKHGHDVHGTAK